MQSKHALLLAFSSSLLSIYLHIKCHSLSKLFNYETYEVEFEWNIIHIIKIVFKIEYQIICCGDMNGNMKNGLP